MCILDSILYVLFQARKSLEEEKGKGAKKLGIRSNSCGKEADRATTVLISILANLTLFYFFLLSFGRVIGKTRHSCNSQRQMSEIF